MDFLEDSFYTHSTERWKGYHSVKFDGILSDLENTLQFRLRDKNSHNFK